MNPMRVLSVVGDPHRAVSAAGRDSVAAMTTILARRRFIQSAACLVAGAGILGAPGEPLAWSSEVDASIIGPKPGFAPQLGTLSSMMAFMRRQVLSSTKGLKQTDLDFLLDAKANTIGALLMHLAATETYYQYHTFDGTPFGKVPEAVDKLFAVASELGDKGRQTIKGHELDYYVELLTDTRAKTIAEFKKRDDKWLMAVDTKWPWGPTNNYCKWFHVCEHEANHNGQIKLIKGRLPGAKESGG
jgi:hypothetical protein